MAKIPARVPYYIIQNVETLVVKLKIFPTGDTAPTEWQYSITKNSYEATVAEELRVNISPFIHDFFIHAFDDIPSGPQAPTGIYELTVIAEVNGVEETHTSYDGAAVPGNDQYLGIRDDNKRIVLPTDGAASPLGYFSFSATGTTKLKYRTNLGVQVVVDVPASPSLIQIAPFIPPGMDIEGATSIRVDGINDSFVSFWWMTFEIDCSFQTDESIGFINWFGVWEFIFVKGRVDYAFKGEESEYTSFATGELQQYNNNLRTNGVANTGWVDPGFYQVVESLLISETTVYYSGSQWSDYIVLTSRDITRKNTRVDKMLNYTFAFKSAHKLIPIV